MKVLTREEAEPRALGALAGQSLTPIQVSSALRVLYERGYALVNLTSATEFADKAVEQRRADLVGAVISAAQNMRNVFRRQWGETYDLGDGALNAISLASETLSSALAALEAAYPSDRDPMGAVTAALEGATSGDCAVLAEQALEAIPDGWAKVDGKWQRISDAERNADGR